MFDVDIVFFDLDDTLLDHRSAERAALADLAAETPELASLPPGHVENAYHAVNMDVWKAYGAGRIDKATAKAIRFERLFQELGIASAYAARMIGDRYLALYQRHWSYRPGAREAFLRAADRLPVGIITNGFVEIQRAKLQQFPELDKRSVEVVVSEEVGLMKPDPALFAWVERRVGVPSGRILYVGDSLHSDIRGGRVAGWEVAWIDGDPAFAPPGVFCFDDWHQLVDRLPARGQGHVATSPGRHG